MALSVNNGDISYFEYKAINELMHSHIKEIGNDLRAIIAVGPLVTGQDTFDIELLEVVDQWQGPEIMQFNSTNSFPLRGKLLLRFLPTNEFENLAQSNIQEINTQELVAILNKGYKIIYEVPAGYARRILTRALGTEKNLTSDVPFADPRRPLAH